MTATTLAPAPTPSRAAAEPPSVPTTGAPYMPGTLNALPTAAPYILRFQDGSRNDVAIAGGKGANLCELTRAGLPVPPGFVLTVSAYDAFVAAGGLDPLIARRMATLDVDDPAALRATARTIQRLIRRTPLPAPVVAAIREAYQALPGTGALDALVAVRSSGTVEDNAELSFAGMFESVLNVQGEAALLRAVKACWASGFTERLLFYRQKRGGGGDLRIAVVVQAMVNSECAGVVFTVNPATKDAGQIVIEGAWGLGEAVVLGQVTPDRWEVDKATLAITSRSIARKSFLLARDPASGDTASVTLDEPKASAPCLSDADVIAIAGLAKRDEAHYGVPQDAEWAIEAEHIYLVQTRPITTLGTASPTGAGTESASGGILLHGVGAGPGVATGPVRVLASSAETSALQKGDVLVASMTTPDWVPLMRRAAAIVTDAGGMTSHAAIVSRELGIPCIVGTRNATALLADGMVVVVDAGAGTVRSATTREAAASVASPQVAPEPAAPAAQQVRTDIVTATRLYVNLGEPALAAKVAAMPVDGVGLLRAEFMLLDVLGGAHPMTLIEEGRSDEVVARMTAALETFAAAFAPRPVIYRATDFRTNEFRGLRGGERFEPVEANPMLGYRGCFRYTQEPKVFALELAAIARVRARYPNLHLMIPFVRTGSELAACRRLIDAQGLGSDRDLQLWIMAEVPSVVTWLPDYAAMGVTGVSIGSNDLTQLVLGVDRDSEVLAPFYDERDKAVLEVIRQIIHECRRLGITCSICGQAPSTHPEIVEQLVRWGIDSISVNPDAVDRTRRSIAAAEQRIVLRASLVRDARAASSVDKSQP